MQHIGFLVSTLSSPGGTGRVVANVANRMVDDYEVHVIGAYHRAMASRRLPTIAVFTD